ncbi:MAG: glycoside hydrolase 43 family protein [Paludibacteraceae bacterium]
MKKNIFILSLCLFLLNVFSQQAISKTWIADLGNGKYRNPILHADYSDSDVCRVGDDYYMTASSFNCVPGLPILHSNDLINWKLIGHALERLEPEDVFSTPQHGKGVWAPSIRYHNEEFYIYWGDPDVGIYRVKTKNPAGKWSKSELVKSGKGLIDPCPLWDDDGRVYLVHAYAGSRAGIKSILAVAELNAEGSKVVSPSRTIYDGHDLDPTIEGAKFYKRNGEYYIFAPAGGVATGWQVVLKSKTVYGPYERKVVLAQGNTLINGPHQGAWVDTPDGEDWFFHFQDKGAFGRVVHLQPMSWQDNGFPVIGIEKDGLGIGKPIPEYRKPNVKGRFPIQTPAESDEFESIELGLQWQWQANPADWWSFANSEKGVLTLFSVPLPGNYMNLWNVPNLLLQKFPSEKFSAAVKFRFFPDERYLGEKAGLVVMGTNYASLSIEKSDSGFTISQNVCVEADKGTSETTYKYIVIEQPSDIYFQIDVNQDAMCRFAYSLDGEKFSNIGKTFQAKEGKWIGAKVGMFCLRPTRNNDGGKIEIDWFRFDLKH